MEKDGTPSTYESGRLGQGSILLVETDAELRRAVAICLKENGWHILPAGDLDEARRILERETPEILVMLGMESPPDREGSVIEVFRKRQTDHRRGSVLIATGERLEEAWRRKYHPEAVIFKPFDVRYLSRRLSLLFRESAERPA